MTQNAEYGGRYIWERCGTVARLISTAGRRWTWTSSDDFDDWSGSEIDPDTVTPVYRLLPPNDRSEP